MRVPNHETTELHMIGAAPQQRAYLLGELPCGKAGCAIGFWNCGIFSLA
jgi:hypothetical protein